MPIYAGVQLGFDPSITQTDRLLGLVEVLDAHLRVSLVLNFQLLGQLEVDIYHLLLVDRLLLHIQVVHDEEVLSTRWLQVDPVYLLIGRQTVVNDVSIVVVVAKYVLGRIDKHLELASNPHLQSNQEDVFLLVKDHADVFELQTSEDSSM